ncbi:MAG: DNA mismatch repair protein MutS [Deltaproteobacteria bacterium]|nr:DNA mismatch repair protein MutS [Deltaproteobacteria bacterium]
MSASEAPPRPGLTPALRQYLETKEAWPGSFLFFQIGDFFELFFEDAEAVAPLLDLSLTSRQKIDGVPVPMCGVPLAAGESYVNRLAAMGHRVVVFEQEATAAEAGEKLARRRLARVVTPGTIVSEDAPPSGRYMAVVLHESQLSRTASGTGAGLAWHETEGAGARPGSGPASARPPAPGASPSPAPSSQSGPASLSSPPPSSPLTSSSPPSRRAPAASAPGGGWWFMAAADLSTGDFQVARAEDFEGLAPEISAFAPSEILYPAPAPPELAAFLARAGTYSAGLGPEAFDGAEGALSDVFGTGFRHNMPELFESPGGPAACGAAAKRLLGLAPGSSLSHLAPPRLLWIAPSLSLDEAALRNLEIVRSLRDGGTRGTLFELLDLSATPMGSRTLQDWLVRPSGDRATVESRHGAVEELVKDGAARERLHSGLKCLKDLERSLSRLTLGRGAVRDLYQVKAALDLAPSLRDLLRGMRGGGLLRRIADGISEVLGDLPEGGAAAPGRGAPADGHAAGSSGSGPLPADVPAGGEASRSGPLPADVPAGGEASGSGPLPAYMPAGNEASGSGPLPADVPAGNEASGSGPLPASVPAGNEASGSGPLLAGGNAGGDASGSGPLLAGVTAGGEISGPGRPPSDFPSRDPAARTDCAPGHAGPASPAPPLISESGSPPPAAPRPGGPPDPAGPVRRLARALDMCLAPRREPGSPDGAAVKDGCSPVLDSLRSLEKDGRSAIAAREAREKARTGIATLKVGYNRVFGYFLEISRRHAEKAPADWSRRQTLSGSERYVSPELAELEGRLLTAGERRDELEQRILAGMKARAAAASPGAKRLSTLLGEADALLSLAETARRRGWVRPRITADDVIDITAGRHPVVEASLPRGEAFVANDVRLSPKERILVVTGPNMAGKSTILRQTAIIVILCQMGSFVPAEKARLSIRDAVFTRVGAADDLARGRSTFMVEMSETARILARATPRSLVVLDEVGRGTSTMDGLAIAWAVAEYLHDRAGRGVPTLFATHYHELVDLARTKPLAVNYNVAVRKWQGRVVFLRKLMPGGTSRSYGLAVAALAGLPKAVTDRAGEVLKDLLEGARRSIRPQIRPRGLFGDLADPGPGPEPMGLWAPDGLAGDAGAQPAGPAADPGPLQAAYAALPGPGTGTPSGTTDGSLPPGTQPAGTAAGAALRGTGTPGTAAGAALPGTVTAAQAGTASGTSTPGTAPPAPALISAGAQSPGTFAAEPGLPVPLIPGAGSPDAERDRLIADIGAIETETLTPLEALNLVHALKTRAEGLL